jgi:hypothetical protein
MVEHLTFNQTVVGSNPTVLILMIFYDRQKTLKLTQTVNSIKYYWFLLYSNVLFSSNLLLKTLLQVPKFLHVPKKLLKVKWSNSATMRIKNQTTLEPVMHNYTWDLFWVYQQTLLNNFLPYFAPHPNFRPFFIFDRGKKSINLNHTKTFYRWVNTYNLLMNLFSKQINPLMFMSKVFKTEVKAFNWSNNTWDYKFFRRVTPYFFLRDASHGDSTHRIFLELEKSQSLFSFITDIKYHEKNAHVLKRFGGYTIGVTPLNVNPWLVSYPIPVGSGSVVVEYFFLSLLSFIRQYTEVVQYNELLLLWKLL